MRRFASLLLLVPSCAFALGQLLPTPAGSQRFGTEVVYLPNGNFVVTDPAWSGGAIENCGAVLLYSSTGELLSRLVGSSPDDGVGSDGIVVLANGNFVVLSSFWDAPGGLVDAGAATWGDADTGFGGDEVTVDAAKSLVGARELDRVGEQPVVALTNGNYAVPVPYWGEDATIDVGAVTWGDGELGTAGQVGPGNSLVGTHAHDRVGESVIALPNGNYVVTSPRWDSDLLENVGAVTLRPGDEASPEPVSEDNSMIGASAWDQAGSGGTVALAANVAFASPMWDRGNFANAGAVTWIPGGATMAEPIGIDNSLVGATADDRVGSRGIIALAGGDYAFASPDWDRGATVDAGAVTRGDGHNGSAGIVGDINSTVGGRASDRVGSGGLTALPNGNFVAVSPEWDDDGNKPDVGAVRWMRGDGGSVGTLNRDAALRGNFAGDLNFARVTVLGNGSYVVNAPLAQNGTMLQAGAVTWCPSDKICPKVIGTSRSLMGARQGDGVGSTGVFALSDGNYVVPSPFVDDATHTDIGGVTWGDGALGTVGVVDASNSLMGRVAGDEAGAFGVLPLANGAYLVLSPHWAGLDGDDVGALTFAAGGSPLIGSIDETNSLHGTAANENAGLFPRAETTPDGRVILAIPSANNGSGAIAVIGPTATGELDLSNSAISGAAPSPQGGLLMRFDYHKATQSLVVGDPLGNRVWLASIETALFHDGFED